MFGFPSFAPLFVLMTSKQTGHLTYVGQITCTELCFFSNQVAVQHYKIPLILYLKKKKSWKCIHYTL